MPPASPITVALGHFDDLLALGLVAAMADDRSIAIVARDVRHAQLDATLRAHRPQVLVVHAGTLMNLAEVRTLGQEHPGTRLIVLTDVTSTAESAQLLAFGASACLARDTQARDVRSAVHLASRGLRLMPVTRSRDAGGGGEATALLTRREGDVLLLLRQGRSNAEIALALHVGVETVRTHARGIYRKLGVSSRRALLDGAPLKFATPSSDGRYTPEQNSSTQAPPSRGGSAKPRSSAGARRAAAPAPPRRPHGATGR